MTQDEFFGAIEGNLRILAEAKMPLPQHNLPMMLCGSGHRRFLRGLFKLVRLEEREERRGTSITNVRVYDLVSGKIPFCERMRFRVFAAYSDEATEEAYRRAKHLVRKWYQESGWATADTCCPYAGAMVVGSNSRWPEQMKPNGDGAPFEHVAFHMLACPHDRKEFGVRAECLGPANDSGSLIFRAMLPEPFEVREGRVKAFVVNQFKLPESVRGGSITVDCVAEKTGVSPDDISNIFNDMQAEGHGIIRKIKDTGGKTDAESLCIDPGKAPMWKRLVSNNQGRWYIQKGFCSLLSVGTFGYLLLLVTKALEHLLPEHIMQHKWALLAVLFLLGTGGILLALRALFKRS